ncbi:MAG TPA: hypothetical protein VH196_03765 [Terriglobales bacterium]|nr:hypothetical protein [Terriglobales bacterium]
MHCIAEAPSERSNQWLDARNWVRGHSFGVDDTSVNIDRDGIPVEMPKLPRDDLNGIPKSPNGLFGISSGFVRDLAS